MSQELRLEIFKAVSDPRQEGKIIHDLYDIIILSICGVLGGSEGWEEIADFGEHRQEWLKQYGSFDNGIPSHDTIARVMSMINPGELQECFINWMQECVKSTSGSVVAIDGKTVRRSYNRKNNRAPIHMVSAFCTANLQVLGQYKVDEKSNEITAIPALLDLLDVNGRVVTIDAMGCQTKIAKKIIDKGADYCLAVKGNQGRLNTAFENYAVNILDDLVEGGANIYNTHEKSHGREELRFHTTLDVFDEFLDLSYEWPGMESIGIAVSQTRKEGEEPSEFLYRFYILSKKMTAKKFAETIRAHWSVENNLHWVLDVGMREDDCKIWRGNAAENLSSLRRIAANLIKVDETRKGGVRRKQKMALMSETYMSQLLEG